MLAVWHCYLFIIQNMVWCHSDYVPHVILFDLPKSKNHDDGERGKREAERAVCLMVDFS